MSVYLSLILIFILSNRIVKNYKLNVIIFLSLTVKSSSLLMALVNTTEGRIILGGAGIMVVNKSTSLSK